MWTSSPVATPTPQGQFCGGDLNSQQQAQSQAQTQAHINVLQRQNALLNQQLHNQTMTHIHHLQQLVPQQHQQPPTLNPNPPAQPPPAPAAPVQSEPPTATASPPSQPPPSPPVNTEDLFSKMKQTLTADLVAAVEKANERNAQLFQSPPPPTSTPQSTSHNPPSIRNTHNPAPWSNRSSSLPHSRERHRDGKRAISIPRSPRRRPRSHVPSRKHQREPSPQRGREGSVTLRSVSLDRRSSSYDYAHEDRNRLRSSGKSSKVRWPLLPPNSQGSIHMANSRPIHRLRKTLHTVPSHRLRQHRDHHSEAS